MSITSLIVIGVICLMLGINPLELLSSGDGIPRMPDIQRPSPGSRSPLDIPGGQQPRIGPEEAQMTQFVKQRAGGHRGRLGARVPGRRQALREADAGAVLGATRRRRAAPASRRWGPFYCPLDRKVYIDLAFYRVLKDRFHAPGDFAQAYVIAHEIGHHVQTLLGVSDKVQALKQQAMRGGDQARANGFQVRMELQADCLAGVWASLNDQMKNRLQPGDVEAGLNAAAQIGDDTLQKRTQGQVVPESFTHGSSQQRVRWFKKGLESGRMQACDTFDGKEL